MILIEFLKKFPDEKACINYIREKRETEGIICKQCETKTKHYWLEKAGFWKCSICRSKTNLRAGTIMEQSKLPILYWFITIHLVTSTKKTFSALELQKQLGHKRYEPIWFMLHKVRAAMGKRDRRYQLIGEIEVDDAFFETVNVGKKKEDILKRGRGSQRQTKVMVMVESEPNPNNKNKNRPSRKAGYVKMVVMDDLNARGINYEIRKSVDPKSHVITDGWRGYSRLTDVVKNHTQMRVPPKEAGKKLPWVHIVISNSKRLLLGTHHSIKQEYLQNYLNEFCYKLNRRHFSDDLFDRMVFAGTNDTWY